jgi:hypothetical protein
LLDTIRHWWHYHHPTAAAATSWFTSDHILALANVVLAAIALVAIFYSYRLAVTADKALLASTQPIVVESASNAVDWGRHNQSFNVNIQVRNVGNGPAFLRKAEFVTGRLSQTPR